MSLAERLEELVPGHLPGLFGIELIRSSHGSVEARMALRPEFMAPNDYLHAGTVVSFADSLCGMGCIASLPEGAAGLHHGRAEDQLPALGARGRRAAGEARMAHGGRTTQVWDATRAPRVGRQGAGAVPLHAVPAAGGRRAHRRSARLSGSPANDCRARRRACCLTASTGFANVCRMTRTEAAAPASDAAALLDGYGRMLLLRRFEDGDAAAVPAQRDPRHGAPLLGQEAVSVGVCSALREDDLVAATYRGHGAALASGIDPQALARRSCWAARPASCGGRAGSMNVVDLEHGLIGCFGIVGGSIAAATGAGARARRATAGSRSRSSATAPPTRATSTSA